jgi:DNA-binding beta-propeller fold protein YncE
MTFARRIWLALPAALLGILLGLFPRPDAAHASYSTFLAPGFQQSDYLTGFPNNGSIGPTGIAIAPSGDIYVSDHVDGKLYHFPASGGVASGGLFVDTNIVGLAIGIDGGLYASFDGTGFVKQLDPATGAVIRVVASGLTVPRGIARDPLSGDLFIGCQTSIRRINHTTDAVTLYTSSMISDVDGIAFDSSGVLYAANLGGDIVSVNRSGVSTLVKTLPGTPDGIAFGAPGTPIAGSVFVNRNDGIISRIDLTQNPAVVSDFATGGTRGDFVGVSPDGYLFATQTDLLVRIRPPQFQAPPQPAGVGGIDDQPDLAALRSQKSTASPERRIAYELAGAAALLTIVPAAGGWVAWRRRKIS